MLLQLFFNEALPIRGVGKLKMLKSAVHEASGIRSCRELENRGLFLTQKVLLLVLTFAYAVQIAPIKAYLLGQTAERIDDFGSRDFAIRFPMPSLQRIVLRICEHWIFLSLKIRLPVGKGGVFSLSWTTRSPSFAPVLESHWLPWNPNPRIRRLRPRTP